jgi:hypothetical protein
VSTNSNNYFQLYLNSCVALAQTIVVKSQETEQGLNQYVIDNFGANYVDETDPTTWKYYMNLSGQYHFTDTMMTVISLDTMQQIDFTPANLLVHTATAAAYVFGTSYYLALVDQYPNQVNLILGILYPVDITTAIAADDGTILGYPQTYVEDNEYTLIQKLQDFIYGFKERWFNPQYGISDELYFTVQLANMYLAIFQAIVAFREEACGTAEMHSFHQQQFLASHQGLDQYMDLLSLPQIVWLCRNINYIQRNVGKKSTFETLIANILTIRDIPLAAYTMRHDVSAMPLQTYPTVFFESDPLNLGENLVASTSWTLDTMLDEEQTLATMNAEIQPDVTANILTAMQNSLSNTLLTKVLNSAMVDETDSTPYTLENTLVNHWLYFSAMDWYTAFLVVDNPVTGEPIVPMNAKDGFVFMWYCYSMSIGIDLTQVAIPAVQATRVVRMPQPSVADIMSVVDFSQVTTSMANDVLSYMPTIVPMISITAFNATGNALWQAANNQRGYVSLQEDYLVRGMTYGMVERIWSDNMVQLGDYVGQTFAQWFTSRNIDLGNFVADDYGLMYTSLVQAATGLNLTNTNSVANLQKAMIGIMEKLSSYSVQYLYEINDGEIKDIDWPMVRAGQITMDSAAVVYDEENLSVFDENVSGSMSTSFDVGAPFTEVIDCYCEIKKQDNITVKSWLGNNGLVFNSTLQVASVKPSSATPLGTNDRGIIPVIGLSDWLALSTTQQEESLVSLYTENWNNSPSAPIPPMSAVWQVTTLTGFGYTPPAS